MTYKTMKKKGSASRNIGIRNIFLYCLISLASFAHPLIKRRAAAPNPPGLSAKSDRLLDASFLILFCFFLSQPMRDGSAPDWPAVSAVQTATSPTYATAHP